jgi:hypothetical protein
MRFNFLVDFDQSAQNAPRINGLHKTNEPGKSTSGLIIVIFLGLKRYLNAGNWTIFSSSDWYIDAQDVFSVL